MLYIWSKVCHSCKYYNSFSYCRIDFVFRWPYKYLRSRHAGNRTHGNMDGAQSELKKYHYFVMCKCATVFGLLTRIKMDLSSNQLLILYAAHNLRKVNHPYYVIGGGFKSFKGWAHKFYRHRMYSYIVEEWSVNSL